MEIGKRVTQALQHYRYPTNPRARPRQSRRRSGGYWDYLPNLDQASVGSTVPVFTGSSCMYESLSDAQLIEQYCKTGNQQFFVVLLNRHHDKTFKRLARKLRNVADAEDCSQKTWIKVEKALCTTYKEQGKFPHFLATVARNVFNDFVARRGIPPGQFDDDFPMDEFEDDRPGPDRLVASRAEVQYVVGTVIPALPVDQRMAWLLYHESIFWEPSLPLGWTTLAMLNGIDVDTALNRFETAQNALLKAALSGTKASLAEEELLIFLVWIHANRADKKQTFTWDYFAELLNVPATTLKTHHSEAKKHINRAIEAYWGSDND